MRLYGEMRSAALEPASGVVAPRPATDTLNTLLAGFGGSGDGGAVGRPPPSEWRWLLSDMGKLGVAPDRFTLATLLRLQTDLRRTRDVWRWGRGRRVRRDARTWHHLIEAR